MKEMSWASQRCRSAIRRLSLGYASQTSSNSRNGKKPSPTFMVKLLHSPHLLEEVPRCRVVSLAVKVATTPRMFNRMPMRNSTLALTRAPSSQPRSIKSLIIGVKNNSRNHRSCLRRNNKFSVLSPRISTRDVYLISCRPAVTSIQLMSRISRHQNPLYNRLRLGR